MRIVPGAASILVEVQSFDTQRMLTRSTLRKPYRSSASSTPNPSVRSPASSSDTNGVPPGVDPAMWASMSASDRRKFVVLGILPGAAGNSGPGPSSTSSRSVASSTTAYSAPSRSTSSRPPLQELPSLPESDLLAQMDRKRAMPWEADSK